MFFKSPALVILSFWSLAVSVGCSNGTKYPSQPEITEIFNHLSDGDFDAFFEHVAEDVHWTLMGTHALAGRYENRTVFIIDAIERLSNTLSPHHPTKLILSSPVIGGGSEEWSVQQLHGTGVCKNGLAYDNMFAWITRWNTNGKIVETNAYLDSALVQQAITENESGVFTYKQLRTAVKPGPEGSNCKE